MNSELVTYLLGRGNITRLLFDGYNFDHLNSVVVHTEFTYINHDREIIEVLCQMGIFNEDAETDIDVLSDAFYPFPVLPYIFEREDIDNVFQVYVELKQENIMFSLASQCFYESRKIMGKYCGLQTTTTSNKLMIYEDPSGLGSVIPVFSFEIKRDMKPIDIFDCVHNFAVNLNSLNTIWRNLSMYEIYKELSVLVFKTIDEMKTIRAYF